MTPERIAEIRARCELATKGPWAWEQYGEKVNCFHVGVAYNKDDKPLEGHVETERYDEDADVFVEDVLWHSPIGEREGATVNYGDADFIAHSRTDEPALLAEVERLEKESTQKALDNFHHCEKMGKIHNETFECRDEWMERARAAEAEVERLEAEVKELTPPTMGQAWRRYQAWVREEQRKERNGLKGEGDE